MQPEPPLWMESECDACQTLGRENLSTNSREQGQGQGQGQRQGQGQGQGD